MGSKLERTDSDIEFQRHHLGCMWGMLHILENHHRNNGKRAIPRRKRGKGRVSTCCKDPKTDSLDHYIDRVQEHSNADGPLLAEQDTAEAAATNRTSAKARMQALITKEMSGRLGLPELELSRHFGSSRYELSGTKIGWGKPIIILQRSADSDANKLHVQSPRTARHARSPERENPGSQSKDHVDVLEIFQVNKKLFKEILHDTEVHTDQKLPIQERYIRKGRLKKSGSFPAAKSSLTRPLKPSTLEHKQKEIWSFAKVENVTIVTESPRFFVPKTTENTASISKSVEVKVAESEYSADTEPPYLQGSSKHWWHPSFTSYLFGIKKKVKQAFKQNKKENGVPIDAPTDESLKQISSSHHDLGNVSLLHVRRGSSLSESVDRYTQLFEHSFSKDAQQYHSRSLRLTAEDRSLSRGYSLKTFKRRLSIPELDSFLPFPEEASNADAKSEVPNRTIASSDTNVAHEMPERLECERNIEISRKISENKYNSGNLLTGIDEIIAEVVDLPEELTETHQDEQLDSTTNSIKVDRDQSPVSVLEAHFLDDISTQPDLPVSKDSRLGACSIHVIEPEASSGLIESSFEDPAEESSKERTAKATTSTPPDEQFLSSNLNRQDDADLNYVRDVLEISGFLNQEYQATWYSIDQPLSPFLFKELETHLHPEEIYHQEDFSYNNDHHHHHQLLFDMINEVLLELFESSLAYFPKQFSFVQSARPIPTGNHILKEVWKRIRWHQSSGLKMDQSLNDIARRDMAKGDGWMNLVLDAEDVALDMEDTIFDELLNEAIDLLDNCD